MTRNKCTSNCNAVVAAIAFTILLRAAYGIETNAAEEASASVESANVSLDTTIRTLVNAAERGDCAAIVPLVSFPVEYWSATQQHGTRDVPINDAADFMGHCDRYIDAATRGGVGHATRATLKDGRIVLTWDNESTSSTFELAQSGDGLYRVVHFVRSAR